jgi:hypothetical protein
MQQWRGNAASAPASRGHMMCYRIKRSYQKPARVPGSRTALSRQGRRGRSDPVLFRHHGDPRWTEVAAIEDLEEARRAAGASEPVEVMRASSAANISRVTSRANSRVATRIHGGSCQVQREMRRLSEGQADSRVSYTLPEHPRVGGSIPSLAILRSSCSMNICRQPWAACMHAAQGCFGAGISRAYSKRCLRNGPPTNPPPVR